MKTVFKPDHGIIIFVALLFASCKKHDLANNQSLAPDNSLAQEGRGNILPMVSVFATGLNNPRGLHFGPDLKLYVAEGGKGGTNSTASACAPVITPVGPYPGSATGGRNSVINAKGERSTLVYNLPIRINALGDVGSVGDLAFVGRTLYALVTGGGCLHGVANVPNGIYRNNNNGTHTLVANLSHWSLNNFVLQSEDDDYEPDGNWYSMVYVNGSFYAVKVNHGEMVKARMNGAVSRVVYILATYYHIVPIVVACNDNYLFVSNLNPFPTVDGSSGIYKVRPNGSISVALTGFTTILGLLADGEGNFYQLKTTTGNLFPTPGTGTIVKVNKKG